jgi:hypothetical protein
MTIDELKTTIKVLEAMQKGPNELQVKAAWNVVAREREKRLAAEKALRDLEIDSAEEITALKGQLRQKQNEIERLNRSWQTREIERLKDLVETLVGTREPAPVPRDTPSERPMGQPPGWTDPAGITEVRYPARYPDRGVKGPQLSEAALRFLKK